MKLKNIWNHHPEKQLYILSIPLESSPESLMCRKIKKPTPRLQLISGWTNPLEKKCSSSWHHFPKSADPSRRDWQISYAGSKRCRWILILAQNPKSEIQNPKPKIQNPKSKIRNPKSKRGRLGPPQKERRLNRSKIQNPKSEIQNPKSKIRNPKSKIQNPKSEIQNPKSKIQTPKSKIQTPKSKRPVWSLDFGFWLRSGRGRGWWPCSKWRCMAVLATRTWPSWRHTGLQPKGRRFDSHARPKLGTDFRRRGFAGNRGSISGPVSRKSGPNFRRNCGPGGVVGNAGSTSRKKKNQAFKYTYI